MKTILKAFSTIGLLLCFQLAWSQNSFSGTVVDDEGEPIQDAEVYLAELERLTITDDTGRFNFVQVPAASYRLIIFAYNFRVLEQEISIEEDMELQISMEALGEQLSEVILTQERERVFALKQLKKVEGTAIYAGKKSEVILIDQITGNLAANNARQIYNQVAGLNIYDNSDAGLQLNIGGRGLDPNRSANFNTRQNGYDISADVLGYPESYYTPPAEALEEIQVVRGAASLQYGTQFGGLINFKFRQPNPQKKIELVSRQTVGSYDLFTSFNSLSGTVGNFEYYTYFNYKEGNGFRPNSAYNSRNYYGNLAYRFSSKSKITFQATILDYLAQQPGGLTDAQFNIDPSFSNRTRNWFDVNWNLFSLRWDYQLTNNSDISLNAYTLNASRKALGFRTNRVSQPDDLTAPRELLVDDFRNWALEARYLHRYSIKDKEAVLLLGSKYYQTDNDQKQGPGTNGSDPDFSFAEDEFPNFPRQSEFNFPNLNVAVFGENIFNLGNYWTLVPGFRFEYIKTESIGSFRNIVLDLADNVLLNEEIPDNRTFERSFILLGLGASYDVSSSSELYGNISQNYRSVTFSDIRVVNPSFQVDPDITDENGFTVDLGIRGRLDDKLTYDLSAFGLYYDDRLGEVLKNEERLNANGELVETGRVIRFRSNIGTAFIYG